MVCRVDGGREGGKEGVFLFHKYRAINLGTRVSINLLPSGENTVYGMNGRRGGESLGRDKLRKTERRCEGVLLQRYGQQPCGNGQCVSLLSLSRLEEGSARRVQLHPVPS